MIFFGLMGLAALVIDMGFARLAQREMQTAVDSAALEGLRFGDDVSTATKPAAQQASKSSASLFSPLRGLQRQNGAVRGGPV